MTYTPKLRMYSGPGKPLYSGDDYVVGYYDAGVMRQVVNEFGIDYKVFSIPVPKDSFQRDYLKKLLDKPSVIYSLVDKNKVVFVTTQNQEHADNWMSYIEELGYNVKDNDKASKRLKSFHRPTLLNAHFELGELNVQYVDPSEYSNYYFDTDVAQQYRDPEIISRLGDGVFLISPRIIQRAVENLTYIFQDHKTQYYHDYQVYTNMVKNLLGHKGAFNARLIFSDGFLKGNCFVSEHLPPGVDVMASDVNLKDEITYSKGFTFLAEPQSPKTKVLSDDQTIINFPQLSPEDEVEVWLKNEYDHIYNKVINNELLANWSNIYQKTFKNDRITWENDLTYLESFSQNIYNAYQWIAGGMKLSDSPWLFQTVSISQARPLQNRFPFPCAVYEQIIPSCIAKMAGYDYNLEAETIVASKELGCHVVDDLDWLEMYESHGGHDGDDFFRLFYRTMDGGDYDGEKVVIAVRSPNGLGEYSIFRYAEDSWYPTYTGSDGVEQSFPTVNGNDWPQRLSEAILTKNVRYTGLPSSQTKSSKSSNQAYSRETVMQTIDVSMSGANVGRFVNATMAHSLVIHKHRHLQTCSLEEAIDNSILPKSKDDIQAIESEAENIMQEVLNSGKPIDEYFYETRGLKHFVPKGKTPNLERGIITRLNEMTNKYFNDYVKSIRSYSQEEIKPLPLVESLGQRLRLHSWATLRSWRLSVNIANDSNRISADDKSAITSRNWDALYGELEAAITRLDRIEDQHDFVIALFYNSLTEPNSFGKVSDQSVMNRLIFPYLFDALAFYGIVSRPVMIANRQDRHLGKKVSLVKISEWLYIDKDTNTLCKYKDPLEYQEAHAKFSDLR